MSDWSVRANIVYRRSYSRPLNEFSTEFETWPQTVSRVIRHQAWLWERAKGMNLSNAELAELAELHDLILQRKVFPSGRSLWLGGTEIARTRESCNFNCLGRETEFITSLGVKSFFDFQDGDETVVWTHKGRWRRAVVRCYGEQQLQKILFVRGSGSTSIRATSNHRWILKDGEVSDQLKVGDKLLKPRTEFNAWQWESASVEEQMFWCYGFVYGDGTLANFGRTSMVRLCGDKNQYVSRFTSLGFKVSYPKSANGDAFVYFPDYRKTLPDLEEDGLELTLAFVRGYLDADAEKKKNGLPFSNPFISIQASNADAIEFIRSVFPLVGVFILRQSLITGSTNYGKRKDGTTSFRLNTGFGESANMFYSVKSIEPDVVEPVWCLEVEEDNSFTLPNGVVTGNCAFLTVRTVFDIVDTLWLLLQGCFVSGTLVEMGDGSFIPIESIKEGDLVKSYDVDTQEFCVKPVVRLNVNPVKSLVKVILENGEEIICTEDHLFLTTEGWVAAKDLEDKEIVS